MSPSLGRLWLAVAALVTGALIGLETQSWRAGAAIALAGALLVGLRRRPLPVVAGLALVAGGLGMTAAATRAGEGLLLTSMASDVPTCGYSGQVMEQAGGLGTLAAIDLGCDGWPPASGLVMLNEGERLDAGAEIGGRGWLLPLGDDPFGRAQSRLGARALLDPVKLDLGAPGSPPLAAAAELRGGVRDAASGLGRRAGGLLLGITIGDTSRLNGETLESFRRAGLAHLLAVSGSNVAIVLGAAALLTRRLGFRVRLFVGGIALGLFVLVVGPDASVLRAACMGGVGLAALGWVRRVDPLHTLGLALLVLVGSRPGMIYAAGLHLSLAATLGIVLWARTVARLLPLPAPLAAVLGVTLSAQVAVAPVLIATFGEFSLVAPLANVLVAPVIAIATMGGMVAGLVDLVAPTPAALIVSLCAPLLEWVLFVAERLGPIRWAASEMPRWGAIPLAVGVVGAAARTIWNRAGAEGRA